MEDRLEKWRLILGDKADPDQQYALPGALTGMDKVLAALYDSERKGGLGSSSPNVNRWLGDIRRYFPTPVVQLMQKDALQRLDLHRMLLEPELLAAVEPDVQLVGTLLSLNKVLPVQTRETAREVVRKVVEELEKKLYNPLREAVQGSLHRSVRNRRPKLKEIDWLRTIRANLRHYQPDLKAIIPEQLIGYGKKGQHLKHLILCLDQSGSMSTSVVYAGVLGCIIASLRSVRTHVIAFDTSVVDLTEHLNDPVDLLFATQLGGGTDIHKALTYAQSLIYNPQDTIFVLISDLFEGGNERAMLQRVAAIKNSGAQFIALLSLDDEGAPMYHKDLAVQLASLDIPAFSCTPDLFPDLMAAAIKREDIHGWLSKHNIIKKN